MNCKNKININNNKYTKYNNFLNVCKINKQSMKIRNKNAYKFRFVFLIIGSETEPQILVKSLIRNDGELDE